MSITTYFRDDSKKSLESYQSQRDIVKDKLARIDIKIDRLDKLIESIDRGLPAQINAINNSISAVKQAYDSRISNGCRNDLIWNPVALNVTTVDPSTGTASTTNTYTAIKDPSQRIDYENYAVKYYRRPKNRDYLASFISTFTGTLSSPLEIAIVGIDTTTRQQLRVGDTIVDDIDNPQYYDVGFFPEVVGFGSTEIVGVTTRFKGTVSSGSSIVTVAIGFTDGIEIGDNIVADGILPFKSKVVGFTTGFTNLLVFDFNLNNFISTGRVAPALIMDKLSIGSTTGGDFLVGIYKTYTSVKINIPPKQYFENLDFDIIRFSESASERIENTVKKLDNPIDPVTIGAMSNATVGFGHSLKIDNSGAPPGPVKWREAVRQKEPPCGGGVVTYYEGNQSWPVIGGLFGFGASYVSEGTTVTVDSEGPQPGYTSQSPTSPSPSTCNSSNNNVTNTEALRDSIISTGTASINSLIQKASDLRGYRNNLEGQAWAYAKGLGTASRKIEEAKRNAEFFGTADFSAYE
jgi:hypothetical protein